MKALLPILLLGCSASPRLLDRVRVLPRFAVIDPMEIRIDVEITNPNLAEVQLRAVDWTLTATDLPSARGRLELYEPIPASGGRRLTLTIRRPIRTGGGPLRLEGLFHFRGAGDSVAAPFSIGLERQ